MKRQKHTTETRTEVERMRSRRCTYAEIRASFPIPKSTLSVWLSKKYAGTFDAKTRALHLQKTRVLATKTIRAKKQERIRNATERGAASAERVPMHEVDVLRAMLGMLYWAEGTKHEAATSLTFTNTDPALVHLYITLLRQCISAEESKFRVRLHLHHYHSREAAVTFWSKLLRVPSKQFGKIYIKQRNANKKFRRNFMGICFVIYHDAAVLRELMAFARSLGTRVASSKEML